MTRIAAVLAIALATVGCSTGDGTDLDVRVPADTSPATVAGSASSPPIGVAPSSTSAPVTTPPSEPAPTASTDAPAASVEPVLETGVPGLDAADEFCAAWSRFGGSFQVVAVHAAFGEGSAESTARYELMAAPTVVEAYEEMALHWPAELAEEFEAAHQRRFGPLAARLDAAYQALVDVGLGGDGAAAMRTAWIDALAERDPLAADVAVELSPELADIVESAVAGHLAAVGSWADDESLVTDVATPSTDAYLSTECPDQGALSGQEVG